MTDSAGQTVVVIGAGQAGGEVAIELRKQHYAGRVLILGEEPYIPYKRPPLSKTYFTGSVGDEGLFLMPRANLDKIGVEFRGDARVVHVDRKAKRVQLTDGSHVTYDKLALATGGRARALNSPGVERPNIFPLRTIADVQAIRAQCAPAKRIVIIGGGFIGLEVAASAIKLGLSVTVLEGLPRVLARVTAPEVSSFFERVHREAGVDLRTGVQVTAFEGEGQATHVVLDDGTRVPGDVFVYGIGIVPNTELAADAGLDVENGIVVDECTRTADPDIVAAGDCTNHPSEFLGRRLRLESVQNAMEQGRAAAHALLDKPVPYRAVPWFWSDQYDLKLQMVGISAGFDQLVLRGDPKTQRAFAAFYLKEGKLIAADTVSRPQDFMLAKKLVALRAAVDAKQLADETVVLKSLLPPGV